MMAGALVIVALAVLAFAASGARTAAYLLYFLAYVPFVSPDPWSGGLQSVDGLGGANVAFKMGLRLVTTAGLFALTLRRRETIEVALRPAGWPVIFYVLWALLGAHRAQDPWIALLRLGELATFYLVGVVLFLESARFHGPSVVARRQALALLPISLATLYFARVSPELASHVGPGGLRLGHKFVESNVLGFAAAATLLWSTHELMEPRARRRSWLLERTLPVAVLLTSAFVLVLARSRTAMVAAVAGELVLWAPLFWTPLLWHGRARRARAVLALSAASLVLLYAAPSVREWFLRGDTMRELASGTGRVELWAALLRDQVPRQPLLGAGYLMLGPDGTFVHAGTSWNNAHNTFVFALVSTGVLGLLAVVGIAVVPLVACARRALAGPPADRPGWTLLAAFQVMVFVTSLTSFGISGYPNAVMLFHFAGYVYCTTPRPGLRRDPTPISPEDLAPAPPRPRPRLLEEVAR